MTSKRKEVESEIAKINKEIENLKWAIKNHVLTAKKRQEKIDRIKELKKIRKDLMKTIEG